MTETVNPEPTAAVDESAGMPGLNAGVLLELIHLKEESDMLEGRASLGMFVFGR